MADARMKWDTKQPRWRAMYKGVPLRISAKKLGGTNATDTKVAANQWFREQQARIDAERAVETFRPNELEYRAELKNLQEKIKALEVVMRDPDTKPMLAPKVEILKRRASRITQALQQSELPPLAKIVNTIKHYREWVENKTRINSIDKFGTKSHIDDYYGYLANKVIEKKIKPKYANDLFGTFKMMFFWFVDEEILKEKEYSNALQRKGNKYSFKVPFQTAEVIELEWVHRILEAAEPRLRLCILWTLNCGFEASEIGQLTKDRYDATTGRITHKRFKTQRFKKVPTVCYKRHDAKVIGTLESEHYGLRDNG